MCSTLKITRNIEVQAGESAPATTRFLQEKHYYDTATGGVRPTDYDGDVRRQQSKRERGETPGRLGPGAKRSANARDDAARKTRL